MRLIPSLTWLAGAPRPAPLDPRLFALLASIVAHGSLRAAADAVAMPYRSAWGLLQDMERMFGTPLVQLQRGRGATLTAGGAALLRADEAAKRRLSREFSELALDVGVPDATGSGAAAPLLRLAASHDPALAGLQDALPAATGARLDIEFCGSREALARFRAGDVDLAGFHVVPGDAEAAQPFLAYLRPTRDRLLRFVDRQQGLIVARGNPRRVASLTDVVGGKLRFVNRQPGSGTRALIDAQLAREGLAATNLRGYTSAEFTHGAVAATIASGHADAGFGVAAAAAEYDLGFVPVVRERYYFAVREVMLRSAAIIALRSSLAGPVFRDLVDRMPGYDATHAGRLERVARGRRRNAKP